jgi:hypothetical protein
LETLQVLQSCWLCSWCFLPLLRRLALFPCHLPDRLSLLLRLVTFNHATLFYSVRSPCHHLMCSCSSASHCLHCRI